MNTRRYIPFRTSTSRDVPVLAEPDDNDFLVWRQYLALLNTPEYVASIPRSSEEKRDQYLRRCRNHCFDLEEHHRAISAFLCSNFEFRRFVVNNTIVAPEPLDHNSAVQLLRFLEQLQLRFIFYSHASPHLVQR